MWQRTLNLKIVQWQENQKNEFQSNIELSFAAKYLNIHFKYPLPKFQNL